MISDCSTPVLSIIINKFVVVATEILDLAVVMVKMTGLQADGFDR